MKVMFIDDEARRMDLYVEHLTDLGHEVIFQASVDAALAALTGLNQPPDLVVLDVSMPPGRTFKYEDTLGGSRTGLPLYDKIRGLWPELKIVAFTNVPDERVAERFRNEDRRLCLFMRKRDVLPIRFGELIARFLAGGDMGDVV